MEQVIAQKIALTQKISLEQVAREEWEMKFLKDLFDSTIGKKVYFKGGTALRLAYASPRSSEDLDFSIIKKITKKEFEKLIKQFAKNNPEIKISDLAEKYNTLLAEYKITESYLPRNFTLKIEISKRKEKKYAYALTLLVSATTNLQILANIEKLEDILKEKIEAQKTRNKARDLFDIWFICNKLKKPMPKNLVKVGKQNIRFELKRFLPQNYQDLVIEFEKKYGR
jgi:predicted nucleotidyltransferase component of viral defense system